MNEREKWLAEHRCPWCKSRRLEELLEAFAVKMGQLASEKGISDGYAVIDEYAEKIRGLQ